MTGELDSQNFFKKKIKYKLHEILKISVVQKINFDNILCDIKN